MKTSPKTGLSVILPAFNEAENINQMVQDCLKYLRKIKDNHEIIIVNDGSKDNTGILAKKIAQKYKNIRIINHKKNKGYGQALASGFKAAKFDYIFFTDSDRQFHLDALDIMYPVAKTGVVDLTIGYRLKRRDKFFRKLLSWGYNTLVGFLFDLSVKDIDCAFKLFKKTIFEKIKIESAGFFFNTEILAKAKFFNFNIVEVGVPHFPRTAGKSTIRLKHIPLTIKELIRIKNSLKKLRVKTKIE